MTDKDSNPATQGGTAAPIAAKTDKDSNPATQGGVAAASPAVVLGQTSPHPAPGVVQTTIDSSTTTVDPARSTVHNRVEPSGTPANPQAVDEKDIKKAKG